MTSKSTGSYHQITGGWYCKSLTVVCGSVNNINKHKLCGVKCYCLTTLGPPPYHTAHYLVATVSKVYRNIKKYNWQRQQGYWTFIRKAINRKVAGPRWSYWPSVWACRKPQTTVSAAGILVQLKTSLMWMSQFIKAESQKYNPTIKASWLTG